MSAAQETPDQHRARLQKYAREVARMVKAGQLTECEAYAKIASDTRRENLPPEIIADVYDCLRWSLENLYSPADAVPSVYAEAGNVQPDPLPYWCAPFYSRLWASALLLGADGRIFLFACHAFADVAGMSTRSVFNFRKAAVRAGAFVVMLQGACGVSASQFMLHKDLHGAWRNLYDEANVRQRFAWLFSNCQTGGDQ